MEQPGQAQQPNYGTYMGSPQMSFNMPQGMPSGGFQYPTQLPMDQNYLNQLVYPGLMQMQQAQLQPWTSTETKTQGAKLGMDYASKIGLDQPAEPNSSMDYRTKQTMADALRNVQSQTARSGMSLSSVGDQARESVMQQAFETMTRNAQDSEERRKALLAQLLSQFAGR